MAGRERIVIVSPDERTAGPPTPGMERQQAFETERLWAGFVRTEPGMVSGWHHHGTYETTIFVLRGALAMEFGQGGTRTVEAGPGDFVLVPAGEVHREGNPSTEAAEVIVVRAGTGESTINVDGPSRA